MSQGLNAYLETEAVERLRREIAALLAKVTAMTQELDALRARLGESEQTQPVPIGDPGAPDECGSKRAQTTPPSQDPS